MTSPISGIEGINKARNDLGSQFNGKKFRLLQGCHSPNSLWELRFQLKDSRVIETSGRDKTARFISTRRYKFPWNDEIGHCHAISGKLFLYVQILSHWRRMVDEYIIVNFVLAIFKSFQWKNFFHFIWQ